MRILLPFKIHNNLSIYDSTVAGGVEKFIKSIYENVTDHEVIPLEYTLDDTRSGLILHKIVTEVTVQKIDVVIINYESSLLRSLPNHINIPIMWICHNMGDMIAKKPFIEYMNTFAIKNSVYMVSEFQFDSWKRFAERLDINLVGTIGGYINSAFDVSGNVYPKEKIYDIIIISRTNKSKDPYWLSNKIKSMKFTFHIPKILFVTTEPTDSKDIEYQNQNTNHVYEVVKNLPHKEVMNLLLQSKVLFSPLASETFGIVGLEAVCHGVPVIATSQQNNCSLLSILGSDHLKMVSKGENIQSILEKANELMDYSTEDCIELQKEYKAKFSKDVWLKQFNEYLEDTVKKYNNSKEEISTLDSIFDF